MSLSPITKSRLPFVSSYDTEIPVSVPSNIPPTMSSTCSVVNCVFVVVILPPSDTAVPSIVIEELASFAFVIPPASLPSLIDPANMAFVTPSAFT